MAPDTTNTPDRTTVDASLRDDFIPLDDLVAAGVIRVDDAPVHGVPDRFPEWWKRFDAEVAIYAIPLEAIQSLSSPVGHRGMPLFDERMAEAEVAFTEACERFFAVGVYQLEYITQSRFRPMPPAFRPDPSLCSWAKDMPDSAFAALNQKSDDNLRQTLAYIYTLWTSGKYNAELDALRMQWAELSVDLRPRFPLVRSYDLRPDDRESHPQRQRFRSSTMDFLDRWGLQSLRAWDHPQPQGSLHGTTFPQGSKLIPTSNVTQTFSLFDSALSGDEHKQLVTELQVQRQQALGLDRAVLPRGDVPTAAHKARIIFLAEAIRQRFPGRKGGGIVAHIQLAAVEWLKLSDETIDIYRKDIRRTMKANGLLDCLDI